MTRRIFSADDNFGRIENIHRLHDLSDVNCVRVDLVEKFVGCEVDVAIVSNVRSASQDGQTVK